MIGTLLQWRAKRTNDQPHLLARRTSGLTLEDNSRTAPMSPGMCRVWLGGGRWRCTAVQDCPSHIIIIVGEVGLPGIVEPRRA
jgi:hypothetical protein